MGYSRVCDGGNSGDSAVVFLTAEYAKDFWVFDIGDIDEVKTFPGVISYLLLVCHPGTGIGWGSFDQAKALFDSGLEVGLSERNRCSYADAD